MIIRDARFFVDCTPNAMTAQFPHHPEPASAHFPFHGPSDFVNTISDTSGFGGVLESTLSASHQGVCRGRDFTNSDRDSGIGKEAAFFGHEVEFHEITSLQNAISGNAVNGLVVHAYANRTRKSIHLGRGGFRSMKGENLC